ncbi:MAG: glycoside hydrolase family 3 N-terminal domain-containing protein [Bacteroidales bacterium]
MISVICKGIVRKLHITLILGCGLLHGFSQKIPVYKDSTLAVELRVHDLLGRMTPEEKFRQLFMIPGDLAIGKEKLSAGIFGLQVSAKGLKDEASAQLLTYGSSASSANYAQTVNNIQNFFINESRLGIPMMPFDEALHGLICQGATSFPQSIGLAASFDVNLMHQVAKAIASESRSRGIRQLLSPVLNIARDVRWGRTEETYGEDPYLVSQMGLAYISEIEKAGIIATPKHFAVNSGEGGRDSYPVHYSERLMEEIYFPAFKTAINNAGAQSVMTAYNSFNGTPCSSNNWLLNKKLKQEWNFRGFVISDACAVGGANVLHYTAPGYADAGKQAIENGLDVIFQTSFSHLELFSGPFIHGQVRQGAIDSAVSRVLYAKFKLGLFEHPYCNPAAAASSNGSPEHRDIALQAAREAIVLLKNENNILPLAGKVKTIAVIGVDAREARLGGYSGPGNNTISILDGIQQTAPQYVKVLFSPGCGRTISKFVTVPAGNLCSYNDGKKSQGLLAAYYDNIRLDGKPKVTRTDATVDFGWTLYGPDPSLPYDWYSARWTGMISSSSTGIRKIGIEGNDGYRLYLDGKLLIDNWVKKSFSTKMTEFSFIKDKEYDFRLEYFESTGNAKLRLLWDDGVTDTLDQSIATAVKLAAKSDMAIVVAGIDEGEFRDRSSLALPGRQEEMIRAIAASGTPVVVILVGGSAVIMGNWLTGVKAVLDVWYPGEAGGVALADVIFGRYNPAGRLPITFPITEGQLPLVYNHKPTGRGDDYNDLSGMPLFPFGYGLSYTSFEYSDLWFDSDTVQPGDSAILGFRLKNTGQVAGDEVCQLYIRDELSSVSRPVSELKGFKRIHLEPGESGKITFNIRHSDLAFPDENMKWLVEPGKFRIMVGSSSKDIRLRGFLTVDSKH